VAPAPPPFLQLAAHPLRWQLLGELARSDLRVGELCDAAGERQNLVSYHLRLLRDGGLVSSRRSAADGRDVYYVLDLERCRELLASAGAALHPALGTRASRAPVAKDVLFLCTGNSARSQMAATLAVQLSDGAVRAVSAGSHPKPLHPLALQVMRDRGLDVSAWRSKALDEFTAQPFDYVISLCDRVREVCPEFAATMAHWSLADPSRDGTLAAFERTAEELTTRIRFLLQSEEVSAHA
jgi:protein-tyrosine-phosphatase/DNA-binding transcriptional ArsR family regulator